MTDGPRLLHRAAGLALLVGIALVAVRAAAAQDTTRGRAAYRQWCAGCHGDDGRGEGPGARMMLPPPRDFTTALYQLRSTATGGLPTDADIAHVIDDGIPGTAMPGWKEQLSDRDRRDLVAYLKSLSRFFADPNLEPVPLEFSRAPGGGADAIRIGRQFYDSIGCRKCHGDAGRGDGPSAPTLEDDAGFPILATDLTEPWRFNGGASAEDIYRRLRTGLDGTPMPSFSDLIEQRFLTDEELWRVAQYVSSLGPARAPELQDVVHAPAITGRLPSDPGDSAWTTVPATWFPLVGQIITTPRWFVPAVTGVWVQAVHSPDSLALRVVWNDRSQSPDSAWLEFATRLFRTVAHDDSTPPTPQQWPDQLVVQFPTRLSEGMERPYFLMGTATDPVYQWRWVSTAADRATGGVARGVTRFDALADAAVSAQGRYDQGQWQVVFTRSLASRDTANQLAFTTGTAIPMAFFVWDGSSGEHGTRMALSTWYFLALDTPTPLSNFLTPLATMALTLGLGIVVVRRTQRTRGSEG